MTQRGNSEAALMNDDATGEGFFQPLVRMQSYRDILYLLLSFPTGIFYFVFLVSGFSIGLGLSLIGVGIFILLLVLVGARMFTAWERLLSNALLGTNIPQGARIEAALRHPLSSIKRLLLESFTWRGILFVIVKFPLGIASFVLMAFLISLTVGLLLAPLLYHVATVNLSGRLRIEEALLLAILLGLGLAGVSIHILSWVAAAWRAIAIRLLAPTITQDVRESGPIIIP